MHQPGTDLGLDRPDLLENHCLIDGQWIPGIKENIAVRDPATGEIHKWVFGMRAGDLTQRTVVVTQSHRPISDAAWPG